MIVQHKQKPIILAGSVRAILFLDQWNCLKPRDAVRACVQCDDLSCRLRSIKKI